MQSIIDYYSRIKTESIERQRKYQESKYGELEHKLKSLLGAEWIYFVEETVFDSDIAAYERHYAELSAEKQKEILNNEEKCRIWKKIICGEMKI